VALGCLSDVLEVGFESRIREKHAREGNIVAFDPRTMAFRGDSRRGRIKAVRSETMLTFNMALVFCRSTNRTRPSVSLAPLELSSTSVNCETSGLAW